MLAQGPAAGRVLFQPDFVSGGPSMSPLTAFRVNTPIDVVLDRNFFAASDSANNRVIFGLIPLSSTSANLRVFGVLGQADEFSNSVLNATQQSLGEPRNLLVSRYSRQLLVADTLKRRVMVFPPMFNLSQFNAPAIRVIGQPDFVTS